MTHFRTHNDVSAQIMGPRIILLLVVLALVLTGFVMIYSASAPSAIAEDAHAASYFIDQVKFAVIGVILAFVLWKFIPYHVWSGPLLWVLWFAGFIALALTAVMGTTVNGAQRWLALGPIQFQPSEFVKIVLVLMAARILSDLRANELTATTFIIQVLLLIVFPVALLFATQSDLGTTAIILLGIIAVMWLGEVPTKWVVAVIVGCVVLALFAVLLSSYRSNRMLYLNPWNDGEGGYGAGYQIIHSYYAFSTGGLFGVGLGNSREKFLYLPESETDFIFSIIGEEFGIVGALVVIGAFLVLLWAGMRIARSAFDDFGCMVAGGLTTMLVFQAFLNIGCAIGVFPTTGKPLPFISSGGSSLVASFIMIGIILAVSQEAGAPSIYDRRRKDLRVVRAHPGRDRVGGREG